MNLEAWGWNEGWAGTFAPYAADGFQPGRVVREDRQACAVQLEEGCRSAEVTGRFRREVECGAADWPVVGDWVAVDARAGHDRAGVAGVLPRRSRLARQAAGRAVREQVLAANLDTVLLVCALDEGRGFNLRRLERGLLLVQSSGAEVVVVLNKADLCGDVAARLREARSISAKVPVIALSAREGWGLEDLHPWVSGCRTAVLLGPSGVGKSALTNALAGTEIQATQPVRESDARGRHTTTRRELFRLPSGGLLIDTAGLREFQPWHAGNGLEAIFPEIAELAEGCRYRDCRHEREPGCAVQQALGEGSLEPERFEQYLRLEREQAYQALRREIGGRRAETLRWKGIAQMQKGLRRADEGRGRGWNPA